MLILVFVFLEDIHYANWMTATGSIRTGWARICLLKWVYLLAKEFLMKILRSMSVGICAVIMLASQVSKLSARPEQVIPAGGAGMVFLVDLDRPVQLVSGVQALTGEMILSIAEKCEDPQDAKAALCLRHLRTAVAKAYSIAIFEDDEVAYCALEAELTPAFLAKFKSSASRLKFGAYSAQAATFGALWGNDAGSLKNDLLVLASDGRLLFGDDSSVAFALKTLAGRESYLPTYGKDTGVHCVSSPAAMGLQDYQDLGARRIILDFKVGSGGRDSVRFELKCNSALEAARLRPKVIADYVKFYSPLIHKMVEAKEPGTPLAKVQKGLTTAMKNEAKLVDNSIIIEFKDGDFELNPQQMRILVEESVVNGFNAAK